MVLCFLDSSYKSLYISDLISLITGLLALALFISLRFISQVSMLSLKYGAFIISVANGSYTCEPPQNTRFSCVPTIFE